MHPQPAPANRPARWLVLALTAVAAIAACNHEDSDSSAARTAIKAEIAKGVHALRTKNIEEYLGQVPDQVFDYDTLTGVNPRDRIRNEVLVTWATIDTTRVLDIKIDSVMAHGDSATVVTTMKWDRLIIVGAKQRDTVITNVKHREIWRKTAKGWRSVKLLSASGGTTRNGIATGG